LDWYENMATSPEQLALRLDSVLASVQSDLTNVS
jgi:hypothetical protein